jgi:hypothetical protein
MDSHSATGLAVGLAPMSVSVNCVDIVTVRLLPSQEIQGLLSRRGFCSQELTCIVVHKRASELHRLHPEPSTMPL